MLSFDDEGMELVRVDAPANVDGKPRVIAGNDLQNKGASSYTKAGFLLEKGQLYVSPINLNREHGSIQTPFLPTQRFVSPIYISDGDNNDSLFGLVVINIDASKITGSLESNEGFEVIMTNSTGGILAHPDPDKCWGFELDKGETLGKLCPVAWNSILNNHTKDDSLDDIYLAAKISIDSTRDDFLEEKVSQRTRELVANEKLMKQDAATRQALNQILQVGLMATSPEELLDDALGLLLATEFLSIENQGAAFQTGRDGSVLVMKAHRNLADPLKEICAQVPFGKCLCGMAAQTGEIVFKSSVDEPECTEAERTGYVKTIRLNGSHLLTIINDILDISKIESGKMEIETMPVSLWEIVDDVIALMMVRAEERGISLTSDYIYPLPKTIKGDPVRLRQILVNLVGNAIKFTAEGSVEIKISMESDPTTSGNNLKLAVVDTGIGMTEEQADKLFKPFSQADVSTTRKYGGTGLGLTISKRLSEMMGGDIDLSSVEGKGSVFTVTLPCQSATKLHFVETCPEASFENEREKSERTEKPLLSVRILLAEDTIVNQKLAVRILTKAGHTVDTAENGKIAMDKALAALESATPYDVILMDMLMPVMDGYAATSALRVSGYKLPIIALTASAMAGDRDKCLAAGCDDFATKPFKKAILLATIQECVEKSMAIA